MESLTMEFTPVGELEFYHNAQGFLALKLNETDYPRVQVRRALPFGDPTRFVCVTDMEDKELALIEDTAQLEDAQRELVSRELELRYYYPRVTQIKSIKEKLGTYYFALCIGEHEKNAAVKDIGKNLRQLGDRIILTDVDGNRFLIDDLGVVNRKSMRMLEAYLY